MTERTIEEVLAAHGAELLRIPGVVGVGQGLCQDRACIRVYLRTAATAPLLPERLEGYPVAAVVTGTIESR